MNQCLGNDISDKRYGPTNDAITSIWYLGNKVIDFDRNTGNIVVENHVFDGLQACKN